MKVLALTQSCQDKGCHVNSKYQVSILDFNQSGQNLYPVIFEYEKGLKKIGQSAKNTKACISFDSPTENSYTLTAILETGDTLCSTKLEGGYSQAEIITTDSNKTKYQIDYKA